MDDALSNLDSFTLIERSGFLLKELFNQLGKLKLHRILRHRADRIKVKQLDHMLVQSLLQVLILRAHFGFVCPFHRKHNFRTSSLSPSCTSRWSIFSFDPLDRGRFSFRFESKTGQISAQE